MGQEQSSETNLWPVSQESGKSGACRPCRDWGNKDCATVKVDAAALHSEIDKENDPHGNAMESAQWKKRNGKAHTMSKEEQECERLFQEKEAEVSRRVAEEQRRVEEQRREMERRVKEEQERLAREAERRRLLLEQQAREREEKERQLQEMRRQGELKRQQQEKERQEKLRLQEEARQKKIKEMDDQKKVRTWLQSNGFKHVNNLVRKKFLKVTPLHAAVGQNNPEMVKLLLAAGADPRQFNSKNETALKLAQKLDKNGSHTEIVQAFAAQ